MEKRPFNGCSSSIRPSSLVMSFIMLCYVITHTPFNGPFPGLPR